MLPEIKNCPESRIEYRQSLGTLQDPEVAQGLFDVIDPSLQLDQNLDIFQQCLIAASLGFPVDMQNGDVVRFTYTNHEGLQKTAELYHGHCYIVLNAIASHVFDDVIDNPFATEVINGVEQPINQLRNDISQSMKGLIVDGKFQEDKIPVVFDEVMDRLTDREFLVQTGRTSDFRPIKRNIYFPRTLLNFIMDGLRDTGGQTKEERTRLVQSGYLQMIRGGEIHSFLPTIEAQYQTLDRKKHLEFRKLLSLHLIENKYWHRPGTAMHSFLYNWGKDKPWKSAPSVEPFVTNASSDLLMFVPFGDQEVIKDHILLLDYLYGKYVYLNNKDQEEEKYWVNYPSTAIPTPSVKLNKRQMQIFLRDMPPFLDEWGSFDRAVVQTLLYEAFNDRPPNDLSLNLLNKLPQIHDMFHLDPNSFHKFEKFPVAYWTSIEEIATESITSLENGKRWERTFRPTITLIEQYLKSKRIA